MLPPYISTPAVHAALVQVLADRPVVQVGGNDLSSWGDRRVCGRAAKIVRDAYAAWIDSRMDWCNEVPHGSPEYHRRRDLTIKVEQPDRLMERLIDAGVTLCEARRAA